MRGGQGHLNHLKIERLATGVTIGTTRQIFILHSLLSLHPKRTMQRNKLVSLPMLELCCSKMIVNLQKINVCHNLLYHSTVDPVLQIWKALIKYSYTANVQTAITNKLIHEASVSSLYLRQQRLTSAPVAIGSPLHQFSVLAIPAHWKLDSKLGQIKGVSSRQRRHLRRLNEPLVRL